MIENIQAFLDDRKELWLKERLKKVKDDHEIIALQQQATAKFSLAEWLSDAANRAKQLTIVSHPAKFSHPRAQVSDIYFISDRKNDGYIKSGNVNYPFDIIGSAGAIDVYKFLFLKLEDGKSILEHLEEKTDLIKQALSLQIDRFEEVRTGFLEFKSSNTDLKTDRFVKQIYFPIDKKNYHILSLLTPSGLLVEVKNRINIMRFSENSKKAKENFKNKIYDLNDFSDIYNTTSTAYGSGNPQGISILNNENSGKYYLLPSIPPTLEQRSTRLPKTDFFKQCLYRRSFQESFFYLNKLMKTEKRNDAVRTAIQNIIHFVIDRIMFEAFKIREYYESGWSNQDYYESLPKLQRMWLDNIYRDERGNDSEWRDELARDIAHWILASYQKTIKDAFQLGDSELLHVKTVVNEAVQEDKEFF